jgi:cell division septation protein DedD
MLTNKIVLVVCCATVIGLSGCSRQQSDWQKTRDANTADAYEQFLKRYPSGEFTAQAQARVKELYEERDWQKARDADTAEAYQAFVKQYPEGKFTEEARIRVENFTLAQTPASGTASSSQAPQPGAGTPAANAPGAVKAPAAGPATAPAKPANPPASSQKHAGSAATHPGSYGIQLGAFKSGAAAADRRWVRLQKQYPELLKGLSSKVVPEKTVTGTLYRLQAFGVTKSHARAICKSLKAKSQACIVVRPA